MQQQVELLTLARYLTALPRVPFPLMSKACCRLARSGAAALLHAFVCPRVYLSIAHRLFAYFSFFLFVQRKRTYTRSATNAN